MEVCREGRHSSLLIILWDRIKNDKRRQTCIGVFSACLTPYDILTVKSRAERIETLLLILTAGYFLDASYIAVDDERVICIIDNKTGFCTFRFLNMFFLYIIDFDFFAASHT